MKTKKLEGLKTMAISHLIYNMQLFVATVCQVGPLCRWITKRSAIIPLSNSTDQRPS